MDPKHWFKPNMLFFYVQFFLSMVYCILFFCSIFVNHFLFYFFFVFCPSFLCQLFATILYFFLICYIILYSTLVWFFVFYSLFLLKFILPQVYLLLALFYSILYQVFKYLQDRESSDSLDSLYSCIWDMTILEFAMSLHTRLD